MVLKVFEPLKFYCSTVDIGTGNTFPFSKVYPVDFVLGIPRTELQSNFNGSTTFGTMKRRPRQRYFELMSVYRSARAGGMIGIPPSDSNI